VNVLGFQSSTTVSGATADIVAAGNGAYGALTIEQSGVDHVIGFLNNGGQVIYIDPQLGKVVTLSPSATVKIGFPP